jgi:hypothetical protein
VDPYALSTLDRVALVVLIVGGLNWALVGLFEINVISALLGSTSSRIVYALVGAASLYTMVLVTRLMSRA